MAALHQGLVNALIAGAQPRWEVRRAHAALGWRFGTQGSLLSAAVGSARQSRRAPDGSLIAPNFFLLEIHPSDLDVLSAQLPTIAARLEYEVQRVIAGRGRGCNGATRVLIIGNAELERGAARCRVFWGTEQQSRESLRRVQELAVARVRHVAMSPWSLLSADRRGRQQVHVLRVGRTRLGRSLDNDIVLRSPTASRRHAILDYDPARRGLWVEDQNTFNGTWVNGRRVRRYLIQAGDVVQCGGERLTLIAPRRELDTESANSSAC